MMHGTYSVKLVLYILTLPFSIAVRETKDSELNDSKRTLNLTFSKLHLDTISIC